MLIVNFIVYGLFPLCIVHAATLNRTGYNEDIITVDDSLVLRGIAACGIMFSHYVVRLQHMGLAVGPAKYYEFVGGMSNLIFFFLSGYGLYASIQQKQPTLDFLKKRVEKTYIPYVIMRLILGCVPGMEIYPWGDSLLDSSIPLRIKLGYVFSIIHAHWFVNCIILLYLLFFISWKYSKKLIPTMFIMTVLVSIGLFYLDFDQHWYNTPLIFVFGMLFFLKRTSFITFMQRRYLLKLAVILIGFISFSIPFTMLKSEGSLLSVISKLISGCFLSTACAALLLKIRFKSPSMRFVGQRSMHWYVVHCWYSWTIAEWVLPKSGPASLVVLAILFTAAITSLFFAIEQRVRKIMIMRRREIPI